MASDTNPRVVILDPVTQQTFPWRDVGSDDTLLNPVTQSSLPGLGEGDEDGFPKPLTLASLLGLGEGDEDVAADSMKTDRELTPAVQVKKLGERSVASDTNPSGVILNPVTLPSLQRLGEGDDDGFPKPLTLASLPGLGEGDENEAAGRAHKDQDLIPTLQVKKPGKSLV